MKSESKKERIIQVKQILRVHPKIVTVEIAENEVILPIKQEMYNKLIEVCNVSPRLQKWYPFLFWLDEKGYVENIYPLRLWKEKEAKKNEKNENVEEVSEANG